MANLLLRYATPLITGLFLVSLVSGIALFFHWGPMAFHGIHEWLSMVLILPFVLHLWKNWRPMTAYFKRAPMAIALALSLLASLAFFIPLGSGNGQKGAPPQVAILQLISAAKPSQIASLVGRTEEEVISFLKDKGFAAAAADRSMGDIAQSSGKSDRDLMVHVASLRR
ncbi:DUF4405 domain-containing protein [Rhizobium sp. SL86]|jgi:hypothetical protein|uniref:DUF4405 domain-containing protein n=1 Tax=Rhizobium sp. SL86 TaxID=2995148 RepID=UPI002273FF4C|nr:DUF4405 domain-containing protein [Rhizobium sp. SL86]MCY1669166.1 DUF4405 domain-containing protein [Rhizobium sp. SL86]